MVSQQTSKKTLSPMANEALADFERLLRVMGKSSLDLETFSFYLASLGYKGDSEAIFLRLVGSRDAHLDTSKLRALYQSPSYTACESHTQTGRELMKFIKNLFICADVNKTGSLNLQELKMFLEYLLFSDLNKTAGEEEKKAGDRTDDVVVDIQELAGEILSRVEGDNINLEQLASILLRYQLSPAQQPNTTAGGAKSIKVDKFDTKTLNPFHSSNDEFVEELEQYVMNHPALNHHFLDSMQKGSFKQQTPFVATHFLQAYRSFTKHFCDYLSGCIDKMEDEHHVELLLENQEEEHGHYEQDDIDMMVTLGLDPEPLKGVTHKDLYVQCLNNLKRVSGVEEIKDLQELNEVSTSLVGAFDAACIDKETSTASSSIAAMYFGSEFLVSKLYGKISGHLHKDDRLTTQDLAFFILHIDMDVEHARLMRKIVVDLCHTQTQREAMLGAVSRIMDGRVDFYDKFVQYMFPPTGHGGTESGKLYNKQSTNWVRKKANCLSDFTGRPVVFDMCRDHIKEGGLVLDVGCGEGYAARALMGMGASGVVGLDISSQMVQRARENASTLDETYLVGDAANLTSVLESHPASAGIVPGMSMKVGCFDLAVGIFVFNYTSIFDMNRICGQVYECLKPGGHFVFSVPHPFMLHGHTDQEDDTFAFDRGDAKPSSYFSLRDRKFSGTIKTLDGRVLNVKMCFKAISDYIEAVTGVGFDISYMHEARVLPHHVEQHPDFFESVKDSPLHIIFKVQKPLVTKNTNKKNVLCDIPNKIRWGPEHFLNPQQALFANLPEDARNALSRVVDRLVDEEGVTPDTYNLCSRDKEELGAVVPFADMLRRRLEFDTGACVVRGVDTSCGEAKAKMWFYLLASLVGTVDGSARGKLFDVRDSNLCSSKDNVLFSVSNREANWHTDGASVHRAYNVASLLCLQPASEGGEFRISNSVNAYEMLEKRLPKFLLYELERSVPRDVLENGKGLGHKECVLLRASRSAELLKRRVRNNAYPIFVKEQSGNESDGLRFRYMRYWIETGHAKAGLMLSPLLSVAMDLLDEALDEVELWEGRLESGDIAFCNNLQVAHGRRSFKNVEGQAPRHKVRAWLHFE